MGSGTSQPPLGPALIPPFYRDAPGHVEQFPSSKVCHAKDFLEWCSKDYRRLKWYNLGFDILRERTEQTEEWRQNNRDPNTGELPDSWISKGPWVSPWTEAAARLRASGDPDFYFFVEPVPPCWPRLDPIRWKRSKEAAPPPPRRDPLILDLDGDGIETVSFYGGTHFDHDGDGFAEQTGWVAADDGLLALDRNANGFIDSGNELFGNETILEDGTKATNGFIALAALDGNKDGKIDSSDAAFPQLIVLKGFDEDGYRTYTLDQLGIDSINLSWTTSGITDLQGNTQFGVGTFVWADGSTGAIAEYGFPTDRSFSIPLEGHHVPENIAALPDLQGSGNVYDLHQAMARDTSGQLKSLVEQFVSAPGSTSRDTLMEQILFKWTDSEGIDHGSRGNNIDARKLVMLEHWFAEPWFGPTGPNPNYAASIQINQAYRAIFELVYSELMSQTHLKNLHEKLIYTWDDEQQEAKTDFSGVIPDILAELDNDPVQGKELLSEFARSLRGISSCSPRCYLTFRETMIEIDPDLGWVFDTGGLPVYDAPHQGSRPWSRHIEGTDNADAVKGSLTEGDRAINGLNGNDVIYGTSRHEHLYNESGDAILVAGGGNDVIWAGTGDDILDGGEGDDYLLGEAGNDTYLFRPGSGQDIINDRDPTPDNIDTIWLGTYLTPEDINLRRMGNNLVLEIAGTSDSLTVQDFFRNNSGLNRVERIQFMDGTVWTDSDIVLDAFAPTGGDDIIYGGIGNDDLSGGGGDDELYGLAGDDTLHGDEGADKLFGGPGADVLEGAAGDDVLDGDTGDDTYLFGRGSGHDTINDLDTTASNVDAIQLGDSILPEDIQLERVGADLKLTISDTGDSITVKDWLEGDTPRYGVEAISFADGTIWGTDEITDILVKGTEGNDLIYGFSGADPMVGAGGDDTLYGQAGDDSLEGDGGNDTLYGGSGEDTVQAGAGNDVLHGDAGNDTLNAGEGDDKLYGGSGDDVLDGGPGNDSLNGSGEVTRARPGITNGNDTYLFGRGSGQDTVFDLDKATGNIDTIRLADDLTSEDITVQRNGLNLELSINGATDRLSVQWWFWNDSGEYRVERVQFADGTIWDVDTIKEMVLSGTSGDDTLIGYSTSDTLQGYGGNDGLYGRGGDDILAGGTGSDTLSGAAGDDTLTGGEGNDELYGGSGDDVLDGAAGNDYLYGGNEYDWHAAAASNGSDTYLFGRGSGQDTIVDYDNTAGNLDTILLSDDTAPADVTIRRSGDDLLLSIIGAADTLVVKDWFRDDSPEYRVERIEFADGTIWDVDTVKAMALQGTPGDDTLIGYSASDTIQGLDGNDVIYGNAGSDALDGGAGDDYLDGGTGDDTYLFRVGSGRDIVIDRDDTSGNLDTIRTGEGLTPDDVTVRREGDNLALTINGTDDKLIVRDWFVDESGVNQVERIEFDDGTLWDAAAIKQMTLQGTPGDDVLLGFSTSDTIEGFAGNDLLYGAAGDDILDGGAGNDELRGETGSDTYLFGPGSGQDIIVDYDDTPGNTDTVMLADGVQTSDITLKRGGDDLYVSIDGTDDQLRLTDWFSDDAHKIEGMQFSDGTVWDAAHMEAIATTPTDTNDYLVGGPGNDAIDGGGGNDSIFGRDGDDTLYGGSGNDYLYGEAGNDALDGGSGDDRLYGGSGDDALSGGEGRDYLSVDGGNNSLDGGAGDDELRGASGDDHLVGGSGNDRLEGRSGTNTLEGGAGNDTIVADEGLNTITVNLGDGFDDVQSHFVDNRVETGTVMVKDIMPGLERGRVDQLTSVNGELLFTAFDGVHGSELWKSDGTEAGTVMVKDIRPGSASAGASQLANVNDTLFFKASDGVHGSELWKSDGTEAGTVMVKDIRPGSGSGGPYELTDVNGTLFFRASDDVHGHAVWKSNGTEAGTVIVKEIDADSGYGVPYELTAVNGVLYFAWYHTAHGTELWKSDGTEAGTVMVKDIRSGSSSPNQLTNVNGTLFFTADDNVHGTELWKSDGTAAGTVLVKDICPGEVSGDPYELTSVNGTLFFRVSDGVHGYELWKSDGTAAGTVMVKDIYPGTSGNWPSELTDVNGTLFFAASDGVHGSELWKSDGTEAGTVMVSDMNPGYSYGAPSELTEVNGTIFFKAAHDVYGSELWKSDGTDTGTVMVRDIIEGWESGGPSQLTNVNGALFFTADDHVHGGELWKSDGTFGYVQSEGDADTIVFGPGITPDDLLVQMRVDTTGGSGGTGINMKLAIGFGDGDGVLIQAESQAEEPPPSFSYGEGGEGGGEGGEEGGAGGTDFTASDLAIKRFVFSDGTVLTLEEIMARADGVIGYQTGTTGDDTLRGSVTNDTIYGLDGVDRIEALDGNDYASGANGDDVISVGRGNDSANGGAGNDVVAGGQGNDYFSGDAGNDVFAFNRGDGGDYIYQSPTAGDIDTVSFGVSITPESVTGYVDGVFLALKIDDGADTIRLQYFDSGGELLDAAVDRVQFIDSNGDARIYDLFGIVQALKSDLEAAGPDTPIELFTAATQEFELTGSVEIAGGDYAVAYAQTGDLFAVPTYIAGSAGDDVINGRAGDDTIDAGAGDDTILAGDGADVIDAGDGADSIEAGSGDDTINAGTGDDTLLAGDGADVIDGGAGADTIDGGSGNDIIDAGDGTDSIDAGSGDDVIRGLQGGDTAIGGLGDDTYYFNRGDGSVSIQDTTEPGAGNTIVFGEGIVPDEISLIAVSDTLTVKIGDNGDEIGLKVFDPQDVNGPHAVDTFRFADGTELSFSDLLQKGFDINGTEGSDLLTGTSGIDRITGLGGDDILVGGGGDDLLDGGGGNDTYVFNLGDGTDTIRDATAAAAGNVVEFGIGVTAADLILSTDGNTLLIEIGSTGDTLRLEGFDPNDPYATVAVETFRFVDGTVLDSTQLLDLGFVIEGTPDADTMTGTGARDLLNGRQGNDVLSGGAGDDTYLYNVGDGVDTITDASDPMEPNMLIFGDGITPDDITLSHDPANRTLILNIGTAGDAVEFTDFDSNDPYGPHAVEYFQFAGGQILTYSRMIDKGFDLQGTTADDSLTGTATTDRIIGDAGADTLAGGAGNDTLTGGSGDDTYLFNPGAGIDFIDDVATADEGNTLIFGGEIVLADMANRLTFAGDTLIIRVGEAGDEVHLSGFDPDAAEVGPRAVQNFQFSDGTIISYEELVRNTFIIQGDFGDDDLTGTTLTDRLYGYEGSDRLSGGLGRDTLTGGVQNDELIGGVGDDTYVFNLGDGVDTIKDFAIPEEGNLILFGEGITRESVSAHIEGDTLRIEYGAGGDEIRLLDFDYNALTGSHVVEMLEFADGSQIPLVSLVDPGTEGDDIILGSYFADVVNAKGGNDTVTTFESSDTIDGGTGDDIIDAGSGDDHVVGGTGSDTLTGGDGYDTYVFNLGDGIDTITDSATLQEGNLIEFGAGITLDDLSVSVDGTTLTIAYGSGGDEIRLLDFDYNAQTGSHVVQTIGFADGSKVRLATLVDPGTEGDDIIMGGYFADVINAKGGADTVTTFESSDTIDGGSGDDTIDAGPGDDHIVGGAGNDSLTGGPGNDTFVFNLGDGVDTITDTALQGQGNRIEFGAGITLDDLSLKYEGATLIITVAAGGDEVRLEGFDREDALGPHGVESFRFADGATVTYEELIGRGFDLSGAQENDTILGTNVNDRVEGLAGDDTIDTGAGSDLLDGGTGADALIGGAGDDIYIVDNANDTVTENPDEGVDTVQSWITHMLADNVENLTLTGSAAINGTGNELNNILLGNAADNVLDGGAGADTMRGGAGSDTYVVDSAEDIVGENTDEGIDTVQSSINYALGANIENLTLTGDTAVNGSGNELNNVLVGNSADNLLDGRGGADAMQGAAGSDTYVVDSADDIVSENADEGIDTVESSVSYALGDNIENLTLTGTASINGTGNELNNALVGNSGHNLLDGGASADTLRGGTGDDTYLVDNANDAVVENPDEGVDTVQSWITYMLADNVENLTLTGDAAINATGNELNNVLLGNIADNLLDGRAGADTMRGAAGSDTYIVDNSGDMVVENPDEGIDTVESSIDYALGDNIENLTLTGADGLNGTGNELDNTLIGNSGANNLTGAAGADTLIGAAGDDTYVFNLGDGVDTITDTALPDEGNTIRFGPGITLDDLSLKYEGSTLIISVGSDGDELRLEGFDREDALGPHGVESFRFADGATVTYGELIGQGFDLSGTESNDTILGTNVDDRADGLAGDDTIETGPGADLLDGGAGADTLVGGDGDDIYFVDNTDDEVIENADEGIDVIQTWVTYVLAANIENLTLTGAAAINGTGNELNNVLVGNTADNVLDGGAGVDTLRGGAGSDTYIVDNSGDMVSENPGEGIDTVHASITYALADNIENLTLAGPTAIDGAGNELNNVIVGNAADNSLTGGIGNDALEGGTGDDTYVFNPGDGLDTIVDSAGADDTIRFGDGITRDDISVEVDDSGAHVRVLDSQGNDTGEGFDINVSGDGNPAVETVEFADGERVDMEDFLYNYVYGTDRSDFIRTGERKDIIYAEGGHDIVFSGGNDDTIYGGHGMDWLNGQSGNDSIYGEHGFDFLFGGPGDDLLDGGACGDFMMGGRGNDTYVVDSRCDFVIECCNQGIDTVESSVSHNLRWNVENLTLTGTASINGVGNSSDNTIIGNSGRNKLTGGAGADILAGREGNDKLYGGRGDDTLHGGEGKDKLRGDRGNDTLHGDAGDDDLRGGHDNDTLYGGDGADKLRGDHGNDILRGDAGNDRLYGHKGDDILDGGAGNDKLYGDKGSDTYMLREGSGEDGIREERRDRRSTDVLAIGSGVNADQVWLRRAGKDLEVSIIGTQDKVMIDDWYRGCNGTIEQFRTDDGKALLNNRVDLLVSAMAAFAPPAPGQTTLPDEYRTVLEPVIAASWT